MERINLAFEASSESWPSVLEECSSLKKELIGRKIYLLCYFMPPDIEKDIIAADSSLDIRRINVGETMAYEFLSGNCLISPSDMTYILLEDYLSEGEILYSRGREGRGDKKFELINLKHRREIGFSSLCLEYIKDNPGASLKEVLANIRK